MNNIKHYLLLGLLIFLCIPINGLTEDEEFELYKSFQSYKISKYRSEKNRQKKYHLLKNKRNINNKKWYYYYNLKKSPTTGAGLAALIPTLGHAYSGQWSRGIPYLITEALGVYLCRLSVEENRTYGINRQQSSSQLEIVNKEMFYIGASVVVLTRVIEIFDAYHASKDYNHKLKKGMGLTIKFESNTHFKNHLMTGLAYRF